MMRNKIQEIARIRGQLKKIPLQWKQPLKVIALLREAAALGDSEAYEELGCWYRDGDESPKQTYRKDAGLSLKYFRLAAEAGRTYGMVGLADALTAPYLSGRRPSSSAPLAEGIRWYQRACRRGDLAAHFNLAITYRYLGEHKKALYLFRKAARLGDLSALLEVARAKLYGIGTRRDVPSALKQLRSVAAAKYPDANGGHEAMLLISQVLREGLLAPRDYSESIAWLRRAAKTGSATARGLLQDEGLSV